jgi:hypothetical protein
MKKAFGVWVTAGLLLVWATAATADITMTFEEFVGSDGAPIGTFYTGVEFQTLSPGLSDWVGRDHSTGNYNTYSEDLGTGGGAYHIRGNGFATTALDSTGNGGKIVFDNADATYVELLYAASNGLYLEAYAANDSLIDSDWGSGNLSSAMGALRVDWDGVNDIAYVLVHDTGNYWLVDNISTDASGIGGVAPLPGAVLLGALGLGTAGWRLRRKAA